MKTEYTHRAPQGGGSDPKPSLTAAERSASVKIAGLFSIRMLGLFMLTPVFAEAAKILDYGNDPFLVGLAIGAYGLTQAIMQIPMGMASDRWGRKAVIVIGLLLFILGAVICAISHDVHGVIVGRAIQGFGAVSAAITAWLADIVRPEVRVRAMAMIGGSIGLSFAASLVLSPLLIRYVDLSGLFWAMGGLGFISLLLTLWVPGSAAQRGHAIEGNRAALVLQNAVLLRLNAGVFFLHFTLMAIFVLMPRMLAHLSQTAVGDLWQFYLPVILASFVFMVPLIFLIESRRDHRRGLLGAVCLLIVVLFALPVTQNSLTAFLVATVLYFTAFNILEALQPAMVSRVCPPDQKGLALGFYNMCQSLGVAAGGAVGGMVARKLGAESVFIMCACLCVLWLLISRNVRLSQ